MTELHVSSVEDRELVADDAICAAIRKFFCSFNNIMSVLGRGRDELLAVHFLKTYCLPVLLCGCEIWQCLLLIYTKLMLLEIIVSENFLMRVGEKVQNRFYITAILCRHLLLIDQRKTLFYFKNTVCESNVVINIV